MKKNIYRVSINDDDIFEFMKLNFDEMLNNILFSMQKKESDSGELTLKLKISLSTETKEQFDNIFGKETISYIKPKFEHKITSSIQIKDERSGSFNEDYKLVSEDGKYYVQKIEDIQQNIFDLNNFKNRD